MSSSHQPNMKPSPSPSLSTLYPNMESKILQKRIAHILLWLLALSTIFLLFSLHSSNPFVFPSKETLNQSPSLSEQDNTVTPKPSSSNPSNISSKETHKQSPPLLEHSNTMSPPPSSSIVVDGSKEGCDLSSGKWVRDPRGSIYTNVSCPLIAELHSCGKYGKDQGYVYWRWKPKGCELPRFEPRVFLNIVRGKKMAFIGDSLAQNQMESLLCLLSQVENPTDIFKDDKNEVHMWYFPSYDFTIMVLRTKFLVADKERTINGTSSNAYDIHLDRVNMIWAEKFPGVHYAIISSGNWFMRKVYLYEGGKLIGCILCKEENVPDLGIGFAIRRIFGTALEFLSKCEECEGLVTLLRTYSPPHFEHGSWFSGGYCNKTEPLNDDDVRLSGSTLELRKIQLEEIKRVKMEERKRNKRFELLDVTKAMAVRADGHPGSHWRKKWLKNVNDCLHWCLPGPIDMWNELLFQVLNKDSLFY